MTSAHQISLSGILYVTKPMFLKCFNS